MIVENQKIKKNKLIHLSDIEKSLVNGGEEIACMCECCVQDGNHEWKKTGFALGKEVCLQRCQKKFDVNESRCYSWLDKIFMFVTRRKK